MAQLEIDSKQVQKKIEEISKTYKDLSGFFNMLTELEKSQTLQRFKRSVRPDGQSWRNPKTRRRGGLIPKFKTHKFNRSLGDNPMIDNGQLMQSIQTATGLDFGMVGTNKKYGKYLQGTQEKPSHWQFLGITPQTKRNVDKAYKTFMEKII